MSNDILVSIVVPTYNRATLIAKTLKSLIELPNDCYEIIIVDDGSTDNTEQVVAPFLGDRISYYKKENAERAAARNYGAKIAKGSYVNFFDSDDIALTNHIYSAVKIIENKGRPEWFHLGYAWATPEGKIFKYENSNTGDTLNRKLIEGNFLSCNGVFVRKDIMLLNFFNEQRKLSASEDFELWLRLAARYPLYYSNEVTSLVIDHEARSVRTINGQKLIDRLELLKHFIESDNEIRLAYGERYNLVFLDIYSYISLHLANTPKYKFDSIKYLLKSLSVSFSLLRKRRFFAIIKNLLIKW